MSATLKLIHKAIGVEVRSSWRVRFSRLTVSVALAACVACRSFGFRRPCPSYLRDILSRRRRQVRSSRRGTAQNP
jgi:hypothetical protein